MTLYEEGKFLLSDPLHLHLGKAWKKENMSVWAKGHPKDGDKRGPVKMINVVLKTRNCVLKTRNCAFKTRNVALKMMN